MLQCASFASSSSIWYMPQWDSIQFHTCKLTHDKMFRFFTSSSSRKMHKNCVRTEFWLRIWASVWPRSHIAIWSYCTRSGKLLNVFKDGKLGGIACESTSFFFNDFSYEFVVQIIAHWMVVNRFCLYTIVLNPNGTHMARTRASFSSLFVFNSFDRFVVSKFLLNLLIPYCKRVWKKSIYDITSWPVGNWAFDCADWVTQWHAFFANLSIRRICLSAKKKNNNLRYLLHNYTCFERASSDNYYFYCCWRHIALRVIFISSISMFLVWIFE